MKPVKPYLTVSVWQLAAGDYAVRGYRRGISVQVARCPDLTEALSIALATPRKQLAVSVVPNAEIGVVTAPAPGTPSSPQNKDETVVTKDASGQVSTTPYRAISEKAALEAIRGERKQHALQFPESGDGELDHGNRMFRAGLSHASSVVRVLPDFVSSAPEGDGGQRGAITHECISIAELDRLRGIERHYDAIVRLTAADQREARA